MQIQPVTAAQLGYDMFTENGYSGGALSRYTFISETYAMGIRFGWFPMEPTAQIIYQPLTRQYFAALTLEYAKNQS